MKTVARYFSNDNTSFVSSFVSTQNKPNQVFVKNVAAYDPSKNKHDELLNVAPPYITKF
jgi:hypothetical protein